MIMNRIWAMPNPNTFHIKPIGNLIERYDFYTPEYAEQWYFSIDPFARNNKFAMSTNDIDPSTTADSHLDALDFLKIYNDNYCDLVLFDPPYSPRQVSECYKKLGKTVNMETTQSSFWSKMKDEVARITKKGWYVISFWWNSNWIWKTRWFEIVEILIIAHWWAHNDTICTVEIKT